MSLKGKVWETIQKSGCKVFYKWNEAETRGKKEGRSSILKSQCKIPGQLLACIRSKSIEPIFHRILSNPSPWYIALSLSFSSDNDNGVFFFQISN